MHFMLLPLLFCLWASELASSTVRWLQDKWQAIRCLDTKSWFITGLSVLQGSVWVCQDIPGRWEPNLSNTEGNTSVSGSTHLCHQQHPSAQGWDKVLSIIQGINPSFPSPEAGVAGHEESLEGEVSQWNLSCLKQRLFAPGLMIRAVSFLPTHHTQSRSLCWFLPASLAWRFSSFYCTTQIPFSAVTHKHFAVIL